MKQQAPSRLVAILLTATLATSCLSIRHTGTRPSPSERGGGISVQVFADDDARRAGRLAPGGIVAALERREPSGWTPVFRSLGERWTVLGLAPGSYRLRFTGRLDASGRIEPFAEEIRRVKVKEGEVVEVTAVLEHVEPALIVAGVITAIAAAILLEDWLDDHDLPRPPLPAPPHEVLDAIFTVGVQIALAPGCCSDLPHGPAVSGHFPADGAEVDNPRPRITVSFSAPLDPRSRVTDAISVVGEASGPVAGTVTLDAERWWLLFDPATDLAAGDTFTVSVHPEGIRGGGGEPIAGPASFVFSTR